MEEQSIHESDRLMELLADRVTAKLVKRQGEESRQTSSAHAAAAKGFAAIAERTRKR